MLSADDVILLIDRRFTLQISTLLCPMAQASSSSFDEWVRSLLNDLQSNNVDMSDFVQYLTGIVTSDSETDEEKRTAIAELLADLDLKVSLSSSVHISDEALRS